MENVQSKITPSQYKRNTACRFCKSSRLSLFLDLGMMPLSGHFPKQKEIEKEILFPLDVSFCENCGLVQLTVAVSRDMLFKDYRYLSSTTQTLRHHFSNYAQEVAERFAPPSKGFVVEMGCNDGVLLKPLMDLGVKVLGVDPATNVVQMAKEKNIPILNDFFGEKAAAQILNENGPADVFCANNVFAHMDDMDDILRGVQKVLKPMGVFIFEVHYLPDLIEKLQYDMIYHEHMSYYALRPLEKYLGQFEMDIFDALSVPIHAGSIRVYARKKGNRSVPFSSRVTDFLKKEEKMGFHNLKTYLEFSDRVKKQKGDLQTSLNKLKQEGKKIIGYGASGRGNVLLNYCDVGKDTLDYLVDASPERYGRFVPKLGIPIHPVETMRRDNPDCALLIAWSYQDEILKKEKAFVEKGGRFIVPLPEVKFL